MKMNVRLLCVGVMMLVLWSAQAAFAVTGDVQVKLNGTGEDNALYVKDNSATPVVVATITATGKAYFKGTVTAPTANATTALQLNGTSINTGGTLSNVAYKDQANTFTQTITTNYGVNAATGVFTSSVTLATNSGYVGIGTTGPVHKLHVQKAGDVSLKVEDSSTGRYVMLTTQQGGQSQSLALYNGAQYWDFGVDTSSRAFIGRSGVTGALYITTSDNVGIGAAIPAGKLAVQGTGTSYSLFVSTAADGTGNNLVVTNAGDVGIGTTVPGTKLEIYSSNAGTGGNATIRLHANSTSFGVQATTDTKFAMGTYSGSGSGGTLNKFFVMDSNGNVGIGTTSPYDQLHVYKDASTFVEVDCNAASRAAQLHCHRGGVLDSYFGPTAANTLDVYSTENIPFVLSLASSEKLRVTTDGNVGIGTSVPGSKLEIYSSDAGTGGNATIRLHANSTSFGVQATADTKFAMGTYSGSGSGGTLNQLFVMDINGNVGIGTTVPASTLELYSTSNHGCYISRDNSGQGGGTFLSFREKLANGTMVNQNTLTSYWTGAAGTSFFSISQYGKADAFVLNDGNVGIGTTVPYDQLHVYKDASTFVEVDCNAASRAAQLHCHRGGALDSYVGPSAANTLDIYSTENIPFVLSLASSEKLRVTTGGCVGIGTTVPKNILHVQGEVTFTNSYANDAVLYHNNNLYIRKGLNSESYTNQLFIDSTGSVGIGTISPGYKLHVIGAAYITGDVSAAAFYYISDVRLKKDIKPIEHGLDTIKQLQGVTFTWKENDKKSVGLIAQDVEKVAPELVATDAQGMKSVQYGNVVAPLIEAVKEQQKMIDAQEARIKTLEAEVKNLRK